MTYWFFGLTYTKYLNEYENNSYQPNFSYSFGYNDWHDGTFSLVYSNYADNRLSPNHKQSLTNFQSGTWDLGYKKRLTTSLFGVLSSRLHYIYTPSNDKKKISFTLGKNILGVTTSLNLSHELKEKNTVASLSLKKFIYKKFFVSGTAYHYFDYDKQKDWEGDYAYFFGWFDSRPFHLSITYSNYYMKTRYKFRDEKGISFLDGNFCVSTNWKF